MRTFVPRSIAVAAIGFALGGLAQAATPAAPAQFASLEVFPSHLELGSLRDSRRVLVTAVGPNGLRKDVTHEARVTSQSAKIAVDDEGYVVPKAKGEAELLISAAGLETKIPVHVADAAPQPVDFVREVIPVLSKVGCNAGTCHGSQAGRAGFKLSLRGYDPLFDYRALVDDVGDLDGGVSWHRAQRGDRAAAAGQAAERRSARPHPYPAGNGIPCG